MLGVQRLLKLFSPAARTALQLLGVVAALRIEQVANLVLLRQVWANAPDRRRQLVMASLRTSLSGERAFSSKTEALFNAKPVFS